MLLMTLLCIGTVLSRFVMISPKLNTSHVLAFKSRARDYSFTITHKSRLDTGIYSAVPLIVWRSDGLDEIYFRGNKLCFVDDLLDVCALGDRVHGRWEVLKVSGRDYMLRNGSRCMLVNRYSIFMSECDADEPKQLFTIRKMESPVKIPSDIVAMDMRGMEDPGFVVEKTYMEASKSAPAPDMS